MTPPTTEQYLRDLDRELRRRGVADPRLLVEVREHLADAVAAGRARGLTEEAAVAAALDRFGAAPALAAQHVRGRTRAFDLGVLIVATGIGLAIAYIDSRPGWDDTGVTALALLLSAGVFGFVAPRRPWLWGTAVGLCTMGSAVAGSAGSGHSGLAAIAFVLILAFPLMGAYGGAWARRLLASAIPG